MVCYISSSQSVVQSVRTVRWEVEVSVTWFSSESVNLFDVVCLQRSDRKITLISTVFENPGVCKMFPNTSNLRDPNHVPNSDSCDFRIVVVKFIFLNGPDFKNFSFWELSVQLDLLNFFYIEGTGVNLRFRCHIKQRFLTLSHFLFSFRLW